MPGAGKTVRLEKHEDSIRGMRMFSRTCEQAGSEVLPVVLVHGLSMSSLYMAPTARRLAERFRVYAPDLPGYGRSQKGIPPLDLPALAASLRAWLDYYEIGPAAWIGNSMGCQIILELALQEPARVKKAVLVGPTIDPRARSYFATLKRGLLQLLFEPPGFYAIALRDYLSHGVAQTVQSLGYALSDPVEQKLPYFRAPVLVVRGSRDVIVSADWAAEVARLLPNARLATVPGGGHVVNYDSPSALARVVEGFLAEES